MGRKNKFLKEVKIKAINEYKYGSKSLSEICTEINCDQRSFLDWLCMYDKYGESILEDKASNNTYTKDFKEKVVKEYLSGAGSLRDMQVKYKIFSSKTLRNWISKYNNGIILTDYKPLSDVYTMKSRKVSYEEKIEIVNYCIANNYDYKGTVVKYNVPYHQVFKWVQNVKNNGYKSLEPQKKGPKPKNLIEPKTPEEVLELENERLRRENERLQLELEVLKKKHRLQKRANTQR